MSITRTLLVAEAQLSNVSNYNLPSTGSINLVAGRVYYLAIRSHVASGPMDFSLNPGTAVTGTAGAWTFVAQTAGFYANTFGRVGLFRYIPASDESSVVVNWNPTDFGSVADCFAFIYEMQGQDTTTPEAQAVATNAVDNASPAQIATNLGSAPSAGNSSLCFVGMCDNTETITPDGNFTEDSQLAGSGSTADSGAFSAQFAATAQQNNTTTGSTTTDDWGGIHAELKAAAAAALPGDEDFSIYQPPYTGENVVTLYG